MRLDVGIANKRLKRLAVERERDVVVPRELQRLARIEGGELDGQAELFSSVLCEIEPEPKRVVVVQLPLELGAWNDGADQAPGLDRLSLSTSVASARTSRIGLPFSSIGRSAERATSYRLSLT